MWHICGTESDSMATSCSACEGRSDDARRRTFFIKLNRNGQPHVPAIGANLQAAANDPRMFVVCRSLLLTLIRKLYLGLHAEIVNLLPEIFSPDDEQLIHIMAGAEVDDDGEFRNL